MIPEATPFLHAFHSLEPKVYTWHRRICAHWSWSRIPLIDIDLSAKIPNRSLHATFWWLRCCLNTSSTGSLFAYLLVYPIRSIQYRIPSASAAVVHVISIFYYLFIRWKRGKVSSSFFLMTPPRDSISAAAQHSFIVLRIFLLLLAAHSPVATLLLPSAISFPSSSTTTWASAEEARLGCCWIF